MILGRFLKTLCPFPVTCVFYPGNVSSPKCSAIVSFILVFVSSSMCDNLLSLTYQAITKCLPFMVLFDMHLSYILTTNPCYFRVFLYRSYNHNADYIQPYKYFSGPNYSTVKHFLHAHSSYVLDSPLTWCPQIHLQFLIWWIFLLVYHHWGMLQGHLKCPSLSLSVRQWWYWLVGLPNIWLARIRLP